MFRRENNIEKFVVGFLMHIRLFYSDYAIDEFKPSYRSVVKIADA